MNLRGIPRLENSVLHIYYLFILNYLISAYAYDRIIHSDFPIPVSPHFLISFIPEEIYSLVIYFFTILALITVSILVINPWIRTFRILALISWIIYFTHESSFGKSNNDHYASTFSMLAFIFLPTSKDDRSKIDQIIFVAKFQAIMCYSMAGLWKIRVLPLLWREGGIMSNLGNAIAMEYMKYGRAEKISPISLFFMKRDYLTGPMFCGLILLQALSPLMIIKRKSQIFFGVMICVFHILSEVMLNINFRSNMYIMVVLFLYDPLIREYQDRKTARL